MKTRILSMLAGSIVALMLISMKAHADETNANWGDLGYANPKSETETKVDNDEIAATISSAELAEKDAARAEESNAMQTVKIARPTEEKSITDISSVQNTFGVETEARQDISIYLAPLAGLTSMVGNDTVDSTPKYAVGATAGVLLLHNLRLDASFIHAESSLSNPFFSSNGIPYGASGVFAFNQNIVSAGAKFFILGRESRVRPFAGGGMSYSSGSLNYAAVYAARLAGQGQYLTELSMKNVQAFGEVGAEIAITRAIVANVSFAIGSVISSSVDGQASYDATRLTVSNSVGRTASYLASAGVGIYF